MPITTPANALKQSPQVRERTHQVLQQTAQQRADLGPELLKDQSKISDEFLDEVGKIGEVQGYDPNMLSALAGNFLDQKAEQGESQKVGAPKKTTEAKWDPQIRSGEVIPPQGKIGEVTTKTTTEPNDENKKTGKTKTAKAPPKVQSTQPSPHAKKNANEKKDDEKVEFSQETREMLNKMQAQGMKTPQALDQSKGKDGQSGEKTDEVFMPSQGVTQAVKVRDRGEIKNGDVITTYRKLDGLPSGSVAILKAKTGKEGLDEYNKRIQGGEKIPQLNQEQQRQLLNPIAEQ